MKIFHVVKVYFDRRKIEITQEWLNTRYKFFQEHTLRSLQAQTVPYLLWICGDKYVKGMVEELLPILPENCVVTYDHDTSFQLEDVPAAYRESLAQADYVYITRIDSDDLYCNNALEAVNELVPQERGKVEAAIFCRGYMHDLTTGRTGVYTNPSSPFHTLLYPTGMFLNQEVYRSTFIGDHSMVARSYPTQRLPDWKFCVLIHGNNFISDFDYGREPAVAFETNWNMEQFLKQSVVFDVDDFCDEWNCLPELSLLKSHYPNFKCTLFTIPTKTSAKLLSQVEGCDWIEIAAHGIKHEPLDEMLKVDYYKLTKFLEKLPPIYTRGFRPPGWYLTSAVVTACNRAGYWLAMHARDRATGVQCQHGYYCCGERLPYWHGHTHDVCGNWLKKLLPSLLQQWPKNQHFSFVSEATLKPQK